MEINADDLSKFLYEKVKHHEDHIENCNDDPRSEIAYHKGSINAYEKIIKEFNLQRLI